MARTIKDAFASIVDDLLDADELELVVGIDGDEENATKLVRTELGIPAGDAESVPARPGGGRVVPRPALSRAWDESSDDVLTQVERGILAGKDLRTVLEDAGDRLVTKFNQVVDARVVAPLRPATLAIRAARGQTDQPLVATGDMRAAVKRRVRRAGEG